MKKEGSLKSILAILVIILICLVSLGGIYVKNNNSMKNILPEYVLGKDLDGSVIVKLDVDKPEDSSKDTNVENETSEENNEQTQKTENTDSQNGQPQEDIYTLKNYKKTKEIIEKRLKIAGMEHYEVRLDEQTGSIVIIVPESSELTKIGTAIQTGKTEIKINETNEIIGDKNSIKSFRTSIDDSNSVYGYGSSVKIEIEFSKNAINKFKELKNNYVTPIDENGLNTKNTVSILVDGNSISQPVDEITFLDSAIKGSLNFWTNPTTDNKALTNSLENINKTKILIDTQDLPLKYTANYINGSVKSNVNKVGIISVFAVLVIVMAIYLIYKYKLQGLFGELSILGLGSALLLVLRCTKVEISVATIVAIIGILILQFIYLNTILKKEKTSSKVFNEKTVQFTKSLIPLSIFTIIAAIISVCSTSSIIPFGNVQEIANFGMVGFWGLILFELINNILTKAMIVKNKNK